MKKVLVKGTNEAIESVKGVVSLLSRACAGLSLLRSGNAVNVSDNDDTWSHPSLLTATCVNDQGLAISSISQYG